MTTEQRAGWRPMTSDDLDMVLAVADIVHPGYPEDRSIFAERLELFPAGTAVAVSDGKAIGYMISHPAILGKPVELNSLLGTLPTKPDCLYLHDVALLPESRGKGLGQMALERLHQVARDQGLDLLALTSTPPARAYWLAMGFVPYLASDPSIAARLASYGDEMTYMTLPVKGGT